MILSDFKAFPRTGTIVGIDWGAVRTGVAVADASREFVFTRPVVVSKNRGADLPERIVRIAHDENAVGIVIGLPLRGDGTSSPTTDAVRAFADAVCKLTDLPICLVDETLSSFVAAEDTGLKTRRAAKTELDSESARVILENAISIMRRI